MTVKTLTLKNNKPEVFLYSKSVAADGDRTSVSVCDVTTELDCSVEGSDGARNSIAQNSINFHRTRNQITHKLRGWERIKRYTINPSGFLSDKQINRQMEYMTNMQTERQSYIKKIEIIFPLAAKQFQIAH